MSGQPNIILTNSQNVETHVFKDDIPGVEVPTSFCENWKFYKFLGITQPREVIGNYLKHFYGVSNLHNRIAALVAFVLLFVRFSFCVVRAFAFPDVGFEFAITVLLGTCAVGMLALSVAMQFRVVGGNHSVVELLIAAVLVAVLCIVKVSDVLSHLHNVRETYCGRLPVCVLLLLLLMRMRFLIAMSICSIVLAGSVSTDLFLCKDLIRCALGISELTIVCIVGLLASFASCASNRALFVRKSVYNMDLEHLRRVIADNSRTINNVLPEELYLGLRKRSRIFRKFEHMTFLLSDFVGFTEFCSNHNGGVVIELLNDYYVEFDGYTSDLGMLKVKTIGDAYFACNFGRTSDGPAKALELAQKMLSYVVGRMDRKTHLSIRIGISHGQAYLALFGSKLFTFDCFGPAVQKVQTLEEESPKNSIHVCHHVKQKCESFTNFIEYLHGYRVVCGGRQAVGDCTAVSESDSWDGSSPDERESRSTVCEAAAIGNSSEPRLMIAVSLFPPVLLVLDLVLSKREFTVAYVLLGVLLLLNALSLSLHVLVRGARAFASGVCSMLAIGGLVLVLLIFRIFKEYLGALHFALQFLTVLSVMLAGGGIACRLLVLSIVSGVLGWSFVYAGESTLLLETIVAAMLGAAALTFVRAFSDFRSVGFRRALCILEREHESLQYHIETQGDLSGFIVERSLEDNWRAVVGGSVMFLLLKNFSLDTAKNDGEFSNNLEDLSKIYSRFDLIVENSNVTKIKSYGNVYLCIDSEKPIWGQGKSLLQAAEIMMSDFLNIFGKHFMKRMLVGIHYGDFTIGIVGRSKRLLDGSLSALN